MIENILDNAACKLRDTNPNLHRWKSWQPNTPFAPIFDLPLWIEDLNSWFINDLQQLIIDKDTGKQLNYEERWKNYNIFTWEEKCVQFVKASVLRVYTDYMQSLNLPVENDLWIRGWAVRLSKGDYLAEHCHSFHENTYLSGNLMISNNQTTTDYYIPHLSHQYGPYKVENKPARMTLFPSWVRHKVDPLNDEDRISLGFDIFTFDTMEYLSKAKQNDFNFKDPILNSIPLVKSE